MADYPWELQEPQGHAVARLADGTELTVLDLGGYMQWQLARPTPGFGGFIASGRVPVADLRLRDLVHVFARRECEDTYEAWVEMGRRLEAFDD